MKDITTHTGKLEVIQRLKSSRNGNPKYLLRLSGITFETATDSSYGYSITNYDNKEITVEIGIYRGKPTLNRII